MWGVFVSLVRAYLYRVQAHTNLIVSVIYNAALVQWTMGFVNVNVRDSEGVFRHYNKSRILIISQDLLLKKTCSNSRESMLHIRVSQTVVRATPEGM